MPLLQVSNWELAIVCFCLLGVFAFRQTGALSVRTIRILDVVLVAAVAGLAMHAAHVKGRVRIVHVAIATTSIVLAVLGVLTSSVTLQRVASGISAYVLAAAFVFLLRVVLRQTDVSSDTLFGAFAAYLSVGVIFAMVYTLIARTHPAAFEPPQPVVDGQTDLYYFSFVTLTSLGYGDITPASDLIRVLSPIEAVIGAILLAALVGRIVGLLVAQTSGVHTQVRLDAMTRAIERLDPNDPDEQT